MSEAAAGTDLQASTCPACGAPLELLPDGTCRWCHATIAPTETGDFATGAKFFKLADSWANHWTLTAEPGTKHAIPWDMASGLLTPAKEILEVLQQGIGQPGLQELAATHDKSADLDWEFCLMLNDVISAGIQTNEHDGPHAYVRACDLLDALAHVKGTDPQWATAASECAADARAQFGSAWAAAIEGDDPDPFQTELMAWTAKHIKHPGDEGHHFWKF